MPQAPVQPATDQAQTHSKLRRKSRQCASLIQKLQQRRKKTAIKAVYKERFERLELIGRQLRSSDLKERDLLIQQRAAKVKPAKFKALVQRHQQLKKIHNYKHPIRQPKKESAKPSARNVDIEKHLISDAALRREARFKVFKENCQRQQEAFRRGLEKTKAQLDQKSKISYFILDRKFRIATQKSRQRQLRTVEVERSRSQLEAQRFQHFLNKSCAKMSRRDSVGSLQKSGVSESKSETQVKSISKLETQNAPKKKFRCLRRSSQQAQERKASLLSQKSSELSQKMCERGEKQSAKFRQVLFNMRQRSEEIILREKQRYLVSMEKKRRQEDLSRRLLAQRMQERARLELQYESAKRLGKLDKKRLLKLRERLRDELSSTEELALQRIHTLKLISA